MTVFSPEQLVSAQQGNLASLFAITNQALQGFQKIVELNLQVVKPILEGGEAVWKQALSGNGHEALLAGQANGAPVVLGSMLPFNRELYAIAADTRAEFQKIAQAQYEKYNQNMLAMVDRLAKQTFLRF